MKKMRRMLALLLTMMMALSLVACGGGESEPAGGEEEEENPPVVEQEEPAGGAELTQESILTYPVTDEAAFSYEAYGDGYAISGCTSKDEVIVVPEEIGGIKVLAVGAYGMSLLEARAVVLPDTVEYIGMAAFTDCKKMEYIHLGGGLKTVDQMAFNACESLKQITFPEGMEKISDFPFIYCSALKEVVIPGSAEFSSGLLHLEDTPNAVVVTPEGSPAEAVAAEYGIPVERP